MKSKGIAKPEPRPSPGASLEDRLEWIEKQRPKITPPPHAGPCQWKDTRVARRDPMAAPDPSGKWFRRACRLCGRFYGYGLARDTRVGV